MSSEIRVLFKKLRIMINSLGSAIFVEPARQKKFTPEKFLTDLFFSYGSNYLTEIESKR